MEEIVTEALSKGVELHVAGEFDLAGQLYESVIKLQPNHADANHNMGLLKLDTGNDLEALPYLQTALQLDTSIAQFWLSYITALINLGRLDEAGRILDLAKESGFEGEEFLQLNKTLSEHQNKLELASSTENQSNSSTPSNLVFVDAPEEAINELINLYNQDKLDLVIKKAQSLTQKYPGAFTAWNILGVAAVRSGILDLGLVAFQAAITIKPDNADFHNNMGNALKEQGKLEESIDSFCKALSFKPDYAEAYNNMGIALKDQGKLEEAIAAYDKALLATPDYAEAHNNMGNALKEQGKMEEAILAYQKAIALHPNYAEAHNNLGALFKEQGKLDLALEANEQARSIRPNYSDAHYNASFIYHLKGELKKGFEFSEWRLRKPKPTIRSPRGAHSWDGFVSIKDKNFLVYEEQGIGDRIQFCRYLKLLEEHGANVTFKVSSKLHSIMQTLDCKISFTEDWPKTDQVDFEAPLMSLPHLFGTDLDTIPATSAYLYADNERIKTWAAMLSKGRFKIGVCWQGSTGKIDLGRSFPLTLFKSTSEIQNVELISLHKGEGERQIRDINFDLTTLGADFDIGEDAFLDTAAVMMNCDLIISSDTAVAHLAGALGCKTWVVLKHIPDWRWMLNRSDSPWYPSITLYRQKIPGDWASVFHIINRDLRVLLDERGQ